MRRIGVLVGRLSLSLAVIATFLAFISGPAAATPQPPVAPTPTPFIWPVRYILTGPTSAHPGDLVSYRVDYEGVADAKKPGLTFTLLWTEGAASFVSLTTLTGPEAKIALPEKRQIDVQFPDAPGPGAVEVTLRLAPDFAGILRVGIEVRGSTITMPDGSVLGALTSVIPLTEGSSLPATGLGQMPAARGSGKAALWLALAGITLLGASAFALRQNRGERG